ncbi:MAG: hypothetical protein ACK4V6_01425 [Microthrixaceae bacterium]
MTIRKGQDWGGPGALSSDAAVLDTDRAAALLLQAALDAGQPLPELGLIGGDLHRSLGSPRHCAQDLYDGVGMRLPIDVGTVRLDDGAPQVFVAHLVATARRGAALWSSRTLVVMNATFRGELDLGPRAHPNDGRLDVTDGVLPLQERRRGRSRARTGSHLPHPALRERRVRELTVTADDRWYVWLDDELVGDARTLEVACVPDATAVVV